MMSSIYRSRVIICLYLVTSKGWKPQISMPSYFYVAEVREWPEWEKCCGDSCQFGSGMSHPSPEALALYMFFVWFFLFLERFTSQKGALPCELAVYPAEGATEHGVIVNRVLFCDCDIIIGVKDGSRGLTESSGPI